MDALRARAPVGNDEWSTLTPICTHSSTKFSVPGWPTLSPKTECTCGAADDAAVAPNHRVDERSTMEIRLRLRLLESLSDSVRDLNETSHPLRPASCGWV